MVRVVFTPVSRTQTLRGSPVSDATKHMRREKGHSAGAAMRYPALVLIVEEG